MSRSNLKRLEKLEEAYRQENPVHVRLWWVGTEKGPDGQMVRKKVRVA